MDNRIIDRRSASRNVTFPVIDSSGYNVGEDRRNGLDRRKYEEDVVIFNILDSLGY